MKYILLPLLYICFALVYFMLRNGVKAKKNIVLGVTLPFSARQEETVKTICNGFLRELNIVSLLLLLPALGFLAIPYESVVLTCFFVWLIPIIIVPYIPYVKYHKRLRAYKESLYPPAESSGERLVDLRAAALPKSSIRSLWFLPPVLIALVPIAYTLFATPRNEAFLPFLLLYGIDLLLVALCSPLYRTILRQRTEMVDDNVSLTAALTHLRRYHWGKVCLIFAYLHAAFSIGVMLVMYSYLGQLLMVLGYTAVILILCIRTEFAVRRAQENLTSQSGQDMLTDEDRYWIWGLFYYNPNDKHLMVNDRVGLNMTVNMARWAGKLILGVSLLLILALPFVGVWTIRLEFTPIVVTLDEAELTVQHTGEVCRIERPDIRSAQLLETLPGMTRISGANFAVAYTGLFQVEGYGPCRLCLNPKAGPFLLIRTEDETWLFSAQDDMVRQVYDALTEN